MWTVRSLLQGAVVALAGCSLGTPSADAAARPFSIAEIADFDSPWAMDFLPGSRMPLLHTALLTERDGRVPSTIVPPGRNSPRSMASRTMPFAARSFTDPPGFMNSALPTIVQPVSSEARRSFISGVLPIAARTFE